MARKFCRACSGLECVKNPVKVWVGEDCYHIGGRACQGFIYEGEEDVYKHPHEELVRQIREVGESLIKNAESLAGTEKYIYGLTINVDISSIQDEPLTINVTKTFYPERNVERTE